MKRAILILILVALSLPAFATGKVTVDPNVAGAAVQKTEEIGGTDARLSQKVTLSESRKLVSVILEDLTKQTGVVFRAGYNSNDWQVRDRRMSIFAKDVPLAQIMNSISHVMKFKWDRKGDDGKWQYRLYMDRRSLLDAESQRLREEERQRAKAVQKRKDALDRYMNVGSLSQADLAKMKETDPLQYFYATLGLAQAMGQMFREVPAMSDAMATGQELTVSGSDMNPQGRAAIGSMMQSLFNLGRKIRPEAAPKFDKLRLDPATTSIQLNHMLAREGQDSMQHLLLADITIKADAATKAGGGDINLPLMDPESAIGRAIGTVLVKLSEGQIKVEDIGKEMGQAIKIAIPKDLESMSKELGEPVTEHPEDPALKVKVRLKPDSMRLADVQKALFESASYAVVSDSFGKNNGDYGFVGTEGELGALLDKITKTALYNWDKNTSVIEFRDREWFRKRAMQIPEATIEGWRQRLRTTGTLDLPDLAEIARLDGEQFNMNVQEDDLLGDQSIGLVVMLNRDLLRFYGCLTDGQRSAILTSSGLTLADLSVEQRSAAATMLTMRNAAFLQKPDAQVTLKLVGKQDGKQINYSFSATSTAEGAQPIKMDFTTPLYKEPKPDKPADKPKSADPAKPAEPAK